MASLSLPPAGAAFDAIAESFDESFDRWLSVAAQRRAVRADLLAAFPHGARLLEIGGGTGTDAAWLIEHGCEVLLTDAAPAMVAQAGRKIGPERCRALPAERLAELADEGLMVDGAYSNFAALNCVADLAPVGEALARLVRPGGKLELVVFGRISPGEMVTEALRGRLGNCLRRLREGEVTASLRGRRFTVRYHGRSEVAAAMPGFRLTGAKAIGLFVPPSAAEPWISRHPRLLAAMESLDRRLARPLWWLGDHVLYSFERIA